MLILPYLTYQWARRPTSIARFPTPPSRHSYTTVPCRSPSWPALVILPHSPPRSHHMPSQGVTPSKLGMPPWSDTVHFQAGTRSFEVYPLQL